MTPRCGEVWVVDSTPVECGRSVETAWRSAPAGWAESGYCAFHSRYFWGLRLHLVCTLGGLPVLFALRGAKADEREVLLGMLATAPRVLGDHPHPTLITDRQFYGRAFERVPAEGGVRLQRADHTGQPVMRSLTRYDH